MIAARVARKPAVDLVSSRFKADPFPFFARLRNEEPVCRVVLPDKNPVWLVTRYEDVLSVLKDDRFRKCRYTAQTAEQLAKMPWVPPVFRPLEKNLLDQDPPDHTRLRALIQKAFTPRLIERMHGRIATLAEELVDRVAARGEMDLIRDFALPLPMTIITEILGVPTCDHRKFHKWSNAIVSVNTFNASWRVVPAIWMLTRYLRRFFRAKRANPGDDLTTALIHAEEAGSALSEDELLAMVVVLLIAGHETTVNLIGNGMLDLMRHPEQMEKLRADPSLVHLAVEELLRFSAPVLMATERFPREPVAIRGVTIPQGEITLAAIASANRDEAMFENPDALDVTRANNRHLAFGQGIHYCVGAPLARLEAQIAISTLLRRLPDLRLGAAPESLRWRTSLILRGMESLPIEF